MGTFVETPGVDDLGHVVSTLREWQHDGALVQLHSGDIGWHWRFGFDAVRSALRVWRRNEQIFAIGFLDAPDLIRMAIAPGARGDDELLGGLIGDLEDPARGVLPAGAVYVEARCGEILADLFARSGWAPDQAWTPLSRSLSGQLSQIAIRYEVIGADQASLRTLVQRSAFPSSTFTDDKWNAMSTGPLYADARCLVAFNGANEPVAAVTVWSAGQGRPGLLEPMGVHSDHRGRGYGREICHAAMRTLQDLGSSSAVVCTRSANTAAIATYVSAGFTAQPEVCDWHKVTAVSQ